MGLSDMVLYSIEPNAFNTKQFANLMKLGVVQVPIVNLMEGIFNGLQNLKVLIMHELNIKSIAPNLLKPLENLETLTLKKCGKQKISVDNLFGCGELNRLTNVTIESCALRDTITAATFTGLLNINELQLGNNQILKIASRSFMCH